ncbi:MAG: polysaccharide biosynthesis protein [Lachnospiraceae bacterium]|nr:polysaccharide biosynthesis protein [Lachnospiraceae bacterium]
MTNRQETGQGSAQKRKRPKICFAASSGGHLEELLMLRPLMERYDSFIVTEKTAYTVHVEGIRCHYLLQVNRLEKTCVPRLFANTVHSFAICLAEQPDVIVCTGVLATIPLCLLCKLFGKTLIYIESFAKVKTPTLTGKLLYRFADRFYIQWPKLQESYPKAVYRGSVY